MAKKKIVYQREGGEIFKYIDDGTNYIMADTLMIYKKDEYILFGKTSDCLFDLLEDEDLVVIEYYVKKYKGRITRIFEVSKFKDMVLFENRHCDFRFSLENNEWIDGKGFNPKLITVMTKEKFKEGCIFVY